MKPGFALTAIMLLTSVSVSDAGPRPPDTCLRFIAPEAKSVISVPLCTLGIDTSCKKIRKTVIAVRYFPANSDTAVISTIGTIVRPPFKQIWKLHDIPNQLVIGIGIFIEATFSTGEVSGMHREGIFLAHQPIQRSGERLLHYEIPGAEKFPNDTFFFPESASASFSAFAQGYWNEKFISFKIHAFDTAFRSAAPDSILSHLGIEVLIDPTHKLSPYPTEDIMTFVVPLSGSPYCVTYTPQFGDSGKYRLTPVSARSAIGHKIGKYDRAGFSVILSVPRYLFGKVLPSEMGFNIIVKSTDGLGGIDTASWIGVRGYTNYSPFLWATMKIVPKPVYKTRWIVLVASFIVGLCIPLFFYLILLVFRNTRRRVIIIKNIPDAGRQFERIKEAIERSITQKEISVSAIAAECGIAPKHLEKIIAKATDLSFKNYVAYLRTEIVCERLRSSHSSEATIAETCGFKNINEMEKYFQKFHRISPFNFRKTQQITQT